MKHQLIEERVRWTLAWSFAFSEALVMVSGHTAFRPVPAEGPYQGQNRIIQQDDIQSVNKSFCRLSFGTSSVPFHEEIETF